MHTNYVLKHGTGKNVANAVKVSNKVGLGSERLEIGHGRGLVTVVQRCARGSAIPAADTEIEICRRRNRSVTFRFVSFRFYRPRGGPSPRVLRTCIAGPTRKRYCSVAVADNSATTIVTAAAVTEFMR